MKPTSFRLPPDTLDRIRRLTQPGESQASVILRAVVSLEASPPPMSMEALVSRLEAVESRLDDLAICSAPVVQTAIKTPAAPKPSTRSAPVAQPDTAAHDRALVFKDQGLSYPDIAAKLNAEGYRTPQGKPLNKDSIYRLFQSGKPA